MKHQPERTCIVCHGKFFKKDLVRYVWKDSGLCADSKQVMAGRGSYCCNSDTCRVEALSERRVKQVFRLDSKRSYVKKLQTGAGLSGTGCR
jgi:predicted RNA-binding protein YlxR (DUF448 family)